MSADTKRAERPITLTADEVRLALAGKLAEIRRAVRPQPDMVDYPARYLPNEWGFWGGGWPDHGQIARSPFGDSGDSLWVREAWQVRGMAFGRPAAQTKIASSGAFCYRATNDTAKQKWQAYWGRWRSPMTMPRHASRLTFEVTAVRVERSPVGTWEWVVGVKVIQPEVSRG